MPVFEVEQQVPKIVLVFKEIFKVLLWEETFACPASIGGTGLERYRLQNLLLRHGDKSFSPLSTLPVVHLALITSK